MRAAGLLIHDAYGRLATEDQELNKPFAAVIMSPGDVKFWQTYVGARCMLHFADVQ